MRLLVRWIICVLGVGAVLVLGYFLGLSTIQHPHVSEFSDEPGSKCAYKSCKAPGGTPEVVRVSLYTDGRTRHLTDSSYSLCEYHASCARKKAWPIGGEAIWIPIASVLVGTIIWFSRNRSTR